MIESDQNEFIDIFLESGRLPSGLQHTDSKRRHVRGSKIGIWKVRGTYHEIPSGYYVLGQTT